MKIQLVTPPSVGGGAGSVQSRTGQRAQGSGRSPTRGGGGGGRGGRGGRRGGGSGPKKDVTAEELDAELDAYVSKN